MSLRTLAGLTALLATCVNAEANAQRTPFEQEVVSLYREMISFRSSAGHNQVRPLAQMLEQRFLDGGFARNEVHYIPMLEEIAGLVVRLTGSPNSDLEPVLFLAHIDIVDARPHEWERDPYELIEEDGFFYGRGSVDNKAGATFLVSSFLAMREEGYVPKRDLILMLTGDEESGMRSTEALVTTHRELTDAEYAINADGGIGFLSDGEATAINVQMAEKTFASFTLTATNPGGHSSAPRDDNAIYDLAAALMKLSEFRFPVRSNDITTAYFAGLAASGGSAMHKAAREFADDPSNSSAAEAFWNTPLVGMTRTTCIATMLDAGHAGNALPQTAQATVNCRIFPDETVEATRGTIQSVIGNDAIKVELIGSADDVTISPPSPVREDVLAMITTAIEAQYPGIKVIPSMSAYGTDGKELRAAGIPTYGAAGLMVTADAGAHGLNEKVPVESFLKAIKYWRTLTKLIGG